MILSDVQTLVVCDEVREGLQYLMSPASAQAEPSGYVWREVDAGTGEYHLLSPSGINITKVYFEIQDQLNDLLIEPSGFEYHRAGGLI